MGGFTILGAFDLVQDLVALVDPRPTSRSRAKLAASSRSRMMRPSFRCNSGVK
jgi:hypothetical protein